MYLLTFPSIPNSITLTGVSDASAVIDSNLDTYVQTSALAPILSIDFGTAVTVEALFVKGENLNDYDLSASNDNSVFTGIETGITVPDHGNSFITFANTTAYRYWRLSFSARGASDPAYRIHEIYLCRLLLDLNTAEKRPLRYRNTTERTGVVAVETWDGETIQYKTGEREKARLTFEWTNLAADVVDELELLWKGPPHAPVLTVYPRPDSEPGLIYRVKWESRFGFKFADAFIGLGKRGQAIFEEI